MEKQPALEQLCGSVEQVIYQNQDTGFAVIELNQEDALVSVVGTMGMVQAGESVSLMGYYTTHPVHGHQFHAQTCEHQMPQTIQAIEKYLSSGVLKGIGQALAKRIVKQFGEDTLLVIEQTPDRLAEVKGITTKRATQLAEQLKQMFGVRNLMIYLAKYKILPAQAVLIWKKWGVLSQEMLEQNPYLICERDIGLTFAIADSMAQDQGLLPDCMVRIESGFHYILVHNLNNGHTCLPEDKLLSAAQKLLTLELELLRDGLTALIEKNQLGCMKKNKNYLCLPDFYKAERYIASRVARMVLALPVSAISFEKLIHQVEKTQGILYDSLQREAILKAATHQIFILTGGPGTGKTTTLQGLIQVLEQSGATLCVAAPTGRAAKRICEVTGRQAKTIHRLLEVSFTQGKLVFERNELQPLPYDVIVIDEMSMVDTLLFSSLLRAVKPSAKLILVGDYDQRATRFHVKSMSTLSKELFPWAV